MRGTVVLVAPLLIAVFAGCLSGGNPSDAEIRAPLWAAGHTWSYSVSTLATSMEMGDDMDKEEEEGDLVLTVYNTLAPLDGKPVYYVRTSDQYDHPLWMGSRLAFDQETLRVVGVGEEWADAYMAKPEPLMEPGSADLTPPPPSPCEGVETIRLMEDEESFPGPTFPLHPGALDRGAWGEEDDLQFTYVMRTDNPTKVETAAGEFEAYPITIDLTPQIGMPDGEGPEFGSFRIRAEYYYAPSVENFVKIDLTASMSGFGEDFGGFEYRSTTELVEFELAQSEESQAPVLQSQQDYRPHVPLAIVADQPAQNLAQGPATTRFAVAPSTGNGYPFDDEIAQADSFPPAPVADEKTHTVYWVLTNPDYEAVEAFVGPVAEFTFDRAGHYHLRAEVRPTVCGEPWIGSAYGSVSNYWEKTWKLNVDPGISRTIDVAKFPVDNNPTSAIAKWTIVPTQGTPLDSGNPLFVGPTGQQQRPVNGQANLMQGEWSLKWEAKGRDLGYGQSAPVVVGDDVEITLRIDYKTMMAYALIAR